MTLISEATPELDLRPPGERYYRHPGDVVRVVLWGLLTTLLALFIQLATGTSEGVTSDLGRAATAVPQAARELLLALMQVAAVAVPAVILIALLGAAPVPALCGHRARRRGRRRLLRVARRRPRPTRSYTRRAHDRHMAGIHPLPVARVPRRRRRRRDGGQAVAGALLAARQRCHGVSPGAHDGDRRQCRCA